MPNYSNFSFFELARLIDASDNEMAKALLEKIHAAEISSRVLEEERKLTAKAIEAHTAKMQKQVLALYPNPSKERAEELADILSPFGVSFGEEVEEILDQHFKLKVSDLLD